eukprot:scaffold203842_cov41-Tisochrysis_lutea.AAC.3
MSSGMVLPAGASSASSSSVTAPHLAAWRRASLSTHSLEMASAMLLVWIRSSVRSALLRRVSNGTVLHNWLTTKRE